MQTYEDKLERAWEINAFHNLGFLIIDSLLEETDHGHKNETREPSSYEFAYLIVKSNITP